MITRRSLFAALAGALWPWKARAQPAPFIDPELCDALFGVPKRWQAQNLELLLTPQGKQWLTLTGNLPTAAGSAMDLYSTTKSNLGPA